MKYTLLIFLMFWSIYAKANDFFGLHLRQTQDENLWPQVPFQSLRLHDDGVQWNLIETRQGRYDWTKLDLLLKKAKAHQVSVLYDFARTPEFYARHSQCATACDERLCAKYQGNNVKGCFPPDDLNKDGSGENSHFKNFVKAFVDHVANLNSQSFQKVSVWEVWNEFDNDHFWLGTNQQLLRMAKDARAIIKNKFPEAIVTTPDAIRPKTLREYLELPGAIEAADALSVHSYVPQCDPEEPLDKKREIYQRLKNDFQNKPIFVTEGSWGKEANCFDLKSQAEFTARYLLLSHSFVDRLWWYGYNYDTGHLADPATGVLQEAGRVWTEIYKWLSQRKPQGCQESGGVWKCSYSYALAVWSAGGQSSFVVPGQYKWMKDVHGVVSKAPKTLNLSKQPVLLF